MSNIYRFPNKKMENRLIGGPIDNARVSLRISGEDLQPCTISALLGVIPDQTYIKGELSDNNVIEQQGSWIIYSHEDEFVPIEHQVLTLISRIGNEIHILSELAQTYKIELLCRVIMDSFYNSIQLPNSLIEKLNDMNISINFEVFTVDEL